MKKILITIACFAGMSVSLHAADSENTAKALLNIERAMAIVDATWEKTICGDDDNMYMADVYNTETGEVSGPSDVWPYTAAIEAHCSLLEALTAIKDADAELYNSKFTVYKHRLELLIDNLEYYRGTFTLASYAANKEWSPYAVPRAGRKGEANVTGILNVYDDQMWLARELIRAYRATGNDDYLANAAYLVDYVIDGWDCWRDADGREYGGITWGPGYNSKHACSNAPVIQPLVWLYDIYKDTDATCDYNYRDTDNNVKSEKRRRADLYLEFARKVYDWQKEKLLHQSGTYWDMMGADNTILVLRGYRQHVDCGGPGGSLFSYNTGTMISGGAELYRVTQDEVLKEDMASATKASLNQFSRYVRRMNTYEFNTDNTAENGFNTWFNDVLMRSYVDAFPYVSTNTPATALKAFQTCLDYAFENHNRGNMLPIHLLDGWGDEVKTKGFHQFSFASEYAMLAVWLMSQNDDTSGVETLVADVKSRSLDCVYTLSGTAVGAVGDLSLECMPRNVYIVGDRKLMLGK